MSGNHFTIEQDNSTVVAHVHLNDLTRLETDQLLDEMRQFMAKVGGRHFVIDMTQVEYLDSSVIGSLVTFLIEVDKNDGRLALVHCQPSVMELVKITGLDTHILLVDSVAAAAIKMEQRDAA
jgi:anti-anti-sigma factor